MCNVHRTWDEELSTAHSLDILREFCQQVLLPRLHPGRSKAKLARAIAFGSSDADIEVVAGHEPDYSDFSLESIDQLRTERQIAALFSKLTFGLRDRKGIALASFLDSETRCKETNQLLRLAREGKASLRPGTCAAIHTARRLIAQVLGRAPALHELDYRLGKGATTSVRKADSTPALKLGVRPSCAAPLYLHLGSVLSRWPAYVFAHSRSVGPVRDGDPIDVVITPSHWDSVQKNFKTERGICKEPDLNVPVQGALGRVIATRLRVRAGIDIRDQTRNQQLARIASISGDIATLDLKSASDLVSLELVYELLPLDWAALLRAARSDTCKLPSGEVIRLEKFSSMGNGYTFPLETLIFWALASAVSPEGISVYGDDLICPSDRALEIIGVYEDCGFAVNTTKSYFDPEVKFRESCGKDFFCGVDVRPVYPRGNLSYRRIVALRNFFCRNYDWESVRFFDTFLPKDLPVGPDGLGDGHLLPSPFSKEIEYAPYRRKDGFGGYSIRSHIARPVWRKLHRHGDAALAALYDCEVNERPTLILQGRDTGIPVSERTGSLRCEADGQLSTRHPGVDDDAPGGSYHLKRIVIWENSPVIFDFTEVVKAFGRWWTVLYRTGQKPRYTPCRTDPTRIDWLALNF